MFHSSDHDTYAQANNWLQSTQESQKTLKRKSIGKIMRTHTLLKKEKRKRRSQCKKRSSGFHSLY